MSRVQLALNVDDVDEAVAFYSKLFATEPAKHRPGYASFAIRADSPTFNADGDQNSDCCSADGAAAGEPVATTCC